MKNRQILYSILIINTLLILSPALLGSQENSENLLIESDTESDKKEYPVEGSGEAPEHIFDMQLGGVGADVFWDGYWRFGLTFGTGFESGKDGFVFPSAFPGLQQGLEFAQEPDFFLSVLLLDHYFVEMSFTEGYDRNTYAMGYVGDETTALKEFRIGNAGIGIGEYEGIDVSSPKYNTPGMMARFETASSEHEIMVRYDPTELQEKTFIGEYEVSEEDLLLPDFADGRFFILPDTSISGLTVYVEDSSGELTGSDGRRYTKRDFLYNADLSSGLVSLLDDPDGRVLIYYTAGVSPVGTVTVNDFIMSPDVNGRPDPEGTLLPFSWDDDDPYDPNYNPLDAPGSPDFRDTSLINIDNRDALLVHNPGTFSSFQRYNRYIFYTNIPTESWRTSISLVDSNGLNAEDQNYIYSRDTDENDTRTLTVQISNTAARDPVNRVPFALENPEVYGPGRETDGTKVSRELLISVRKDSTDYYIGTNLVSGSVKVYVNGVEDKTADINYDSGTISFSRYIFPEDRIVVNYRTETIGLGGGDLFIAQGNRLFINDFTTVELAESLRWSLPETQMTEEAGESPGVVNLAGTVFYEKPDLSMMFSGGLEISTSDTTGNLRLMGMEKNGYTFSISEDQAVSAEQTLSPTPVAGTRRDLLYKDFESTSLGGQTYLNDYTWGGASVDSSREGPSIAASRENDPFSGRVLVMSYSLNSSQWSAGDFLPVESGPIDLSGYSQISFYTYLQNGDGSNLTLKLRIGENGEAEDWDENGTVDSGDSRYLLEKSISLPASQDNWYKVSIPLTSAERKQLTRVRSLRFLLEASATTAGELLVGGITGTGSPLNMKVYTSGGTERDTDGLVAREVYDTSLASAFPEVSSIFHPDGEDQKVLKVNWSSLDAADLISGSSRFNSVPVINYGEMALYIRHDTPGVTGTISMTDSKERGIVLDYTAGSSSWEKLTVDLKSGTASFSGSSTVENLSIDKNAGDFSQFKVTRTAGAASGTFWIDEIHFSEPTFTTGGSAEAMVDYKKPGIIKETSGGFPLVADFNIYSRFNYQGQTTESYFSNSSNRLESQFSTGIDLVNVRLQGDFEVVWSGGEPYMAGGHLVRIPSKSKFGWISDSYSRSFQPGEDYMTRGNVIHLTPFSFLTVEAETTANATISDITQGWGGLIKVNAGNNSSISANSDLYQTSNWESDSSSYFNDWSNDFKYIVPLEEGIQSREGLGSFSYILNPIPVGVKLDTKLEYEAYQDLEWLQENRWYSDISFPVEIKGNTMPLTISPGYRRDLTQLVYPDNYSGFEDDMSTLFGTLGTQFPMTHFIPFYEITGRNNLDYFERTLADVDESEYNPEMYINISRMTGSSLKDLFVPSGVDFAMGREYYKKQDSVYIRNEWTFQLLQSAVNVLGAWGQYPVFDFYATDEWSSSLQLILSGDEMWTPEMEELVYQNYITLAGETNWEFVVDNRFSKNWESLYVQDDFQLILRWREGDKEYVQFPFIDYLIMKPNYMEHEEKLIFTGYFDREDSESTSYNSILRHQSKLVINGLGSIAGWMALGLGGAEELFRSGFELGLELEMKF